MSFSSFQTLDSHEGLTLPNLVRQARLGKKKKKKADDSLGTPGPIANF